MIDRAAIEQILAQYKRHGWELRRILLSTESVSRLSDLARLFSGVEVRDSDLDAAWFSRSSRPGMTAWEIRYLGQTPYALIEGLEDDLDADAMQARLEQVESRMRKALQARTTGNSH